MNSSSVGAGYFYYNDITQQFAMKGNLASDCTCLGFWVRSDLDLGYFYEFPGTMKNQVRMVVIPNALTSTSTTTFMFDYSINYPTLNIK